MGVVLTSGWSCDAARLGYRYVWQTDDDSRVLDPVTFDIREYLQRRGLLMAAARRVTSFTLQVTC